MKGKTRRAWGRNGEAGKGQVGCGLGMTITWGNVDVEREAGSWRVGMRVWEEERWLWDSFCRDRGRGKDKCRRSRPEASQWASLSSSGNEDKAVRFFLPTGTKTIADSGPVQVARPHCPLGCLGISK